MSYGMAGRDYHGDPFLGGIIGAVAKGAISLGKKALGFDRPQPQRFVPSVQVPVMPGGQLPGGRVRRVPGVRGVAQRLVPGGATGFEVARPRRKRINPANPKALRRAIRRQDGFVKLARRALKGTAYTITTRGSRRPRRDIAAGHTHVR